jgi:phosphoribosylamine--glycine ligase
MRVLVIGSGGREHAICWKLKQSPHITRLYCAPGNPGISEIAECLSTNMDNSSGLASLADSINADLVVVGPEAPLVNGVVEACRSRELRVVGPSRSAARLEGSKIFAKQFMARHAIPTARFRPCSSAEEVRSASSDYSFPVVVKADGLAAGKGVRIIHDHREFEVAIEDMMVRRVFGSAGESVVLEECLVGREASVMIFTDGGDYKVIVPAQDYKRVGDGDVGANTGGMGSFSTPGLIDDKTLTRINQEIIEPTLIGMSREGDPFRGILYAGLMLTDAGPRVIEYNVRFGDPETQVVLTRLESDLFEIFESIVEGKMGDQRVEWSQDSTVCVVMASRGYPADYEKGRRISGLDLANSLEGTVVFHAGTSRDSSGTYMTSGGRVLGVTSRGASLEEARSRAYEAVGKINFEGAHYRKDIALIEA